MSVRRSRARNPSRLGLAKSPANDVSSRARSRLRASHVHVGCGFGCGRSKDVRRRGPDRMCPTHDRTHTDTRTAHRTRQSGAARAGNSPGGGFAGNHTHHSRQRAPQDTRLHTRQGHKHSAQHPHTFAYHNHIAHAAGLLTHSRPIALTHPTSARAMRPNAPLSTPPPPLRCAPTGGRTGCRRAKCARGADGAASGQNADSPA